MLMPDQVFIAPTEQTSTARAHFGAHSSTGDLVKVLSIKLKEVKHECEFCQAYKSHSGNCRAGPPVNKNGEPSNYQSKGRMCKENTHPKGKDGRVSLGRFEDIQGMVCIFNK